MRLSGVFKGLYRGHGIYWHGTGYGDETNVLTSTYGGMRQWIDAKIVGDAAKADAAMTDAQRHWETIAGSERRKWRQLSADSEWSAAEYAYIHRNQPTE